MGKAWLPEIGAPNRFLQAHVGVYGKLPSSPVTYIVGAWLVSKMSTI